MFCDTCKKRPTCTELCDKVKKALAKEGIYGSDWIRPQIPRSQRKREIKEDGQLRGSKWREIPFSSISEIDIDRNPMLSGD